MNLRMKPRQDGSAAIEIVDQFDVVQSTIQAASESGDVFLIANNLSEVADKPTARTNLGLAIGSDVQAYDAELAAIAGLTSAADRLPYFTGSGTAALATFTTAGRNLVDDADATAQRTTLGLGTAATQNTGTSGATIPFCNGAITWASAMTFSSTITFGGAFTSSSGAHTIANPRFINQVEASNPGSYGVQISCHGPTGCRIQNGNGAMLFVNNAGVYGGTQHLLPSSTTSYTKLSYETPSWITNTHASRVPKLIRGMTDAGGDKPTSQEWTDGSRGYFAISAPNGTAPDSNQPNNTVCFYRDGSNNLQVRYKNNGGTTTDINLGAVT